MLPAASCYKKLIVLCGPWEEWQKYSLNSGLLTLLFNETVPWHQDGEISFSILQSMFPTVVGQNFPCQSVILMLTLKIHNAANSFDHKNRMILVLELFYSSFNCVWQDPFPVLLSCLKIPGSESIAFSMILYANKVSVEALHHFLREAASSSGGYLLLLFHWKSLIQIIYHYFCQRRWKRCVFL